MTSARSRREAIERGLSFFYETARVAENLDLYGHDYLFCLHWISSTSQDATLADSARNMGKECARRWRNTHASIPDEIDANVIADLLMGDLVADQFGIRDANLASQIKKATAEFTSYDYFSFDPAAEPPPTDVPEQCDCGEFNFRGNVTCDACGERLEMASRYEVWLDALIAGYLGEQYGVKLGATYLDVLKWLPTMRPYPNYDEEHENDFIWSIYAVTHVVYTLNGYSTYRLSPVGLTDEFEFLQANINQVIEMEDPETVGEMLDSLRAFGLPNEHELIRQGQKYLLDSQNPDGSWGEIDVEDIYGRYHPTVMALNGLRDHSWSATKSSPLLVHTQYD
jgi:hypothetical protein